jgi:xylan 1,4-beta-xylosidase
LRTGAGYGDDAPSTVTGEGGMNTARRVVRACAGLASACACAAALAATPPAEARFDWFEYLGRDPVHSVPAGPGEYRNPILGGFHPDPSIVRVGADYYLVTSTFSWYPGIPVFHSRDLVGWTQIGNAVDRPDMLRFDGLGMSRGVFAPTIEHHDGAFYIANTCVDCGGNFVIRASDPAGPWSDPIWTPQVGGIDPSLFFDDDGRVYILNNDAPAGPPRYDGHRAIWIRQVDPVTFQSVTEQRVLVDGGVRPERNPIWIEAPHLYRVDGTYYLFCAEGGTGDQHSQVVLRSRRVTGPYEPYPGNPVLTQRHLDPARPNPVTSTGHADMVETQNGEWWAVFLGTRPYEDDLYNTGRETFLMPVRWRDGWPVITEGEETVPPVHTRPRLPAAGAPVPLGGDVHVREEFDAVSLSPHWLFIRTVREAWHEVRDGALVVRARDQHVGRFEQPSFVGRRLQNAHATISTQMRFAPARDGAGLDIHRSAMYNASRPRGMYRAHRRVRVLRWLRRHGRSTMIVGKDLVAASATPLVLGILSEGESYGYAIIKRVAELSGGSSSGRTACCTPCSTASSATAS